MATQNTPGPWTVARQSAVTQALGVCDVNGGLIAKVGNRGSAKADAALIASAPALLDALQHLVANLQRTRDGDYLLINDGTGLSRYTDIIAKATGQ